MIRLRRLSKGQLISALWQAAPNRYRRMIDTARRIDVVGSFGKYVVVRVVTIYAHANMRKVALLAVSEMLSSRNIFRHRVDRVVGIKWSDWDADYPSTLEPELINRMIEREEARYERANSQERPGPAAVAPGTRQNEAD